MEKSTDFVDIHPLSRLVHQGFGVLWLCENFRFKSSHLAGRLCAVGLSESRETQKGCEFCSHRRSQPFFVGFNRKSQNQKLLLIPRHFW